MPGYEYKESRKTHYIHGCDRGRNKTLYGIRIGPVTSDLSEVDCKNCLKVIKKKNLQPRICFPEVPTFDVVAEGRYRNLGCPDSGCYLVFNCPVCGKKNIHGGYYGKIGEADGHRNPHCDCWEEGYYIREIASIA
jgi:hypothetical protein